MKFLAASNDHGETNITRQQIAGLSKQIELANSRLAQLLFAANKIDKHLGLDKPSKPEPVAQPHGLTCACLAHAHHYLRDKHRFHLLASINNNAIIADKKDVC